MNSTNRYAGVSNTIATSKGNITDSMTTIAASKMKNRCFIGYPPHLSRPRLTTSTGQTNCLSFISLMMQWFFLARGLKPTKR